MNNAIKQAVFIVGNQTKLANAVGVRPQAVQKWCETGNVPANRVLAVEAATSGQVTRHELRPDLYPPEVKPVISASQAALERFQAYSAEPVTDAVLKAIEIEAEKAKISMTDALNVVVDRGWRTFKARWYCVD